MNAVSLKIVVATIFVFAICHDLMAQFRFSDSFRGSQPADIVVGGATSTTSAYFTSGNVDPVNNGWLRLTESVEYRRGYAYLNKSFPSSLGVLIDFEYTAWRSRTSVTNTPDGGDGFSVFLFDANSPFTLGGYGGSLGYAPLRAGTTNVDGMGGGYIGVGFDQFGNFGRSNEGRVGGYTNPIPNSIVLRGPTTADPTTTNRFLAAALLGDRSGTVNDIRTRPELAYNVISAATARPSDATFYRRVQIELKRLPSGEYNVNVRWRKQGETVFTQLINTTIPDVPPNFMKIGFMGSTGNAVNFFELRDASITTLGNLRVHKMANKNNLILGSTASTDREIEYTIEVTNDTENEVTGIQFLDLLKDEKGNKLSATDFTISSISLSSGFMAGSSVAKSAASSNSSMNGNLSIPAKTTGVITVKGQLNNSFLGTKIVNEVNVDAPDFADDDMSNNQFTVETPVIRDGVDLMLERVLTSSCINSGSTNAVALTVFNNGRTAASYHRAGVIGRRLVVTKTIPAGITFANTTLADNNGWDFYINNTNTNTERIATWVARGSGIVQQSLAGNGAAYPSQITYTLGNITSNYIDITKVEYRNQVTLAWEYNGANIEPEPNRLNSTNSFQYVLAPIQPPVVPTLYYCMDDVADPLTVANTNNYTPIWYLTENGLPSTIAPRPNTQVSGTFTYYVSYSNGLCEGPKRSITIVVYPKPTAGAIAINAVKFCAHGNMNEITNTTSGSSEVGDVSYHWEESSNGVVWDVITGVTSASYTPSVKSRTGVYRYRRAVQSMHGCVSYSNIIEIKVVDCRAVSNPILLNRARQQN